MSKIAILTCKELTPDTTVDDYLCFEILKDKGHQIDEIVWDEDHDFSSYDFALIRTTWDYQHKADHFQKRMKEIAAQTRLINPLETVLWNMNKKYLMEFDEMGLPVIPSKYHEEVSSQQIESYLAQAEFAQGLIIKPTVGGSSHGIQLIKQVSDYTPVAKGEWLIQPFLPGIQERGEYSLIYFAGKFSHAICKLPKSQEFRCQEEYGSNISAINPDEKMFAIAEQILNQNSYHQDYARVDLIPDGDSYKLVELELIEPCLFLHYEPEKAPVNMANFIASL